MIDYHKNNLTESGDFIISHSHLCKLDPQLGGHPKLFYKALTAPEIIEKPSFEKGDILHAWMQHGSSFIVEDVNKPTEKLEEFAKTFYKLYFKEEWKFNAVFLEVHKQKATVGIEEYGRYRELYIRLHNGSEGTDEQRALFVALVRFARTESDFNKNLKEATAIEKFAETIRYIEFLKEANGKVAITATMKDMLENAKQAISEHPFAAKLIHDMKGEAEKEYFWQKMVNGTVLNRKAKLDKEIVDYLNKELTIVDLKTTSFPIALFPKPNYAYERYALGRQLTSYREAFFENHKNIYNGEWKTALYNVVVQTTDEYPVMVYRTPFFNFKDNLAKLEERAAWHIKNNQWKITMDEMINENKQYIEL